MIVCWQSMTRTPLTTSMVVLHDADAIDIIHDCVALHDANTNDHFYWHPQCLSAHSVRMVCAHCLIFLLSTVSHHLHTHHGSSYEFFHSIYMVIVNWAFLHTLILLFYYLRFHTHLFFFLPAPEVRRQLVHSAQREYGLYWWVLPFQRHYI